MGIFLRYLGVYLIVGVIVIVLLNVLTNGRIFRNFGDSVYDGQDVMFSQGLPMGTGSMKILMIAVVWLFWPVLVFGAVERRLKKKPPEIIGKTEEEMGKEIENQN